MYRSTNRLLSNLRTLLSSLPDSFRRGLPDVGAGGVLYGWVLVASHPGRIGLLPGALLEPSSPVLPPAAFVLLGVLEPLLGALVLAVFAGPVAFALLRWGNHAGYVSAGSEGEVGGVSVGEFADLPRRLPGHYVVLFGAHGVDVARYASQVYGAAHELYLARLYEVVLEVGIPDIEAVRVAGHPRAVRVPIKHVEGGRLLAQQVVVDHVRPDQLARAQEVEHVRHFAVVEIAPLHHLHLHELYLRLVHKDLGVPNLRVVLERNHEGGIAELLLLFLVVTGREPGQRNHQECAADAVPDGVNSVHACDLAYYVNGLQGTQGHVVLELGLIHRGAWVLPADHEDREALLYEVPYETVLLPQVEDVVLVDPGREEE